MSRAVYAGSFDLLTIGHEWMIKEGSKLFDELIVAVGDNPDKKNMFTNAQRVEMLKEITRYLDNVRIGMFTNQFLFDYARQEKCSHILRGIRNPGDYEFERAMRNLNSDFDPLVQTVFLMPPRGLSEISSSLVKGLIGPQGWEDVVQPFVPEAVFQHLLMING